MATIESIKLSELKTRRIWCIWKQETTANGRITKIPYSSLRDKAKSNDPTTWLTHTEAVAIEERHPDKVDGIGIFFAEGLAGVDIDAHDQENEAHNPLEAEIRELFKGTYQEYSPSGRGVHVLFLVDPWKLARSVEWDKYFTAKNTEKELEFYVGGMTNRYFTYTGDRLNSEPITDQTDAFLIFLDKYMKRLQSPEKSPQKPSGAESEALDTEAIQNRLAMAKAAENGEKFKALYERGELSGHNNDASSADEALCCMLAYWLSGDVNAIDEAFRESALYRTKWDEKRGALTYGEMTIAAAVKYQSEHGGFYEAKTRPQFKLIDPEQLTEARAADLYAEFMSDKALYTPAMGWLTWNGQYWQADANGAHENVCIQRYTRAAWAECMKAYSSDAKAYKPVYSYGLRLRTYSVMRSIQALHQAQITVPANTFDSDPYALNTAAGIVDLRTGEIKPHDPAAYCTQIAPFTPSATGAEMWADFLRLITSGNTELEHFLKVACGMCCVGRVNVEVLQIAYGGGRNGKSTFYNAIGKVLGSYAGTISADALMYDPNGTYKFELSALRGKRLVICGELEQGQRLSTKALKRVASTDPLKIESKYKDPEIIEPTHHIVMFTNYRPHVAAEDNGTWRRLHVIPFTATMPTGDAEITDYASILAEQAGGVILKWLIEGAGEYIEAGHKLPMVEAMDTAKQEYRSSEDYTAAFIRERCIEEPTERIPLSVLYSEYRQYTQAAGVFTLKSPDFRSKLEQSGYTIKNTGNRPAVCGLKLAPSEG